MTQSNAKRETFSGRKAFIMAAIGSAVGLGNIWRFPYTTYENGGGAFIIPYLIALLTAGIPLLFLDYAIGHRHRGGAPLSYRRFNPHFEVFGWWQVMVNVIIGLYYAVVLGWAASYTYFSLNSAWGDQPIDFFLHEFLKMGDISNGVSFEFVGMVTGPLIAVWLVALGVLSLGIQKGNSKIGENQYVLSGHGESRDALRKLKVGTPITIQNRPELAQVNTTGGAALQAGTMVLKNGNYVGADGTNNKARSFIGTTKDHNLVVLTVDKAGLQSVGVTQQEGAQLLSKLGVVDGAELSNQGSVDLVVNDTYVHKATSNPTTYEDIVIIK